MYNNSKRIIIILLFINNIVSDISTSKIILQETRTSNFNQKEFIQLNIQLRKENFISHERNKVQDQTFHYRLKMKIKMCLFSIFSNKTFILYIKISFIH